MTAGANISAESDRNRDVMRQPDNDEQCESGGEIEQEKSRLVE
jgi:hypothetical protein